MKDIGRRFKEIRENLGFTQNGFGEIMGLSQDSISAIERNKNNPNVKILEILHIKYKVNLNWLIAGTGIKFAKQLEATTSSVSLSLEIEKLKQRIENLEKILK